jgi:uridine kinase
VLIEKHFSALPDLHRAKCRTSRAVLVAIVGGSGSGKTWLTEKLQRSFGRAAARISQDDFYRDRSRVSPGRRGAINFDHPRAIDWTSLERVLRASRQGRSVRVPAYDFKTHCRAATSRVVRNKEILLVDGLWLLRKPVVRRLFDVTVFIDCPARTRLRRRLARDMAIRGRSRASVLAQFRQTVEPMHRKFVTPQARWADFVAKGKLDSAAVRRIIRAVRHFLNLRKAST